MTATIQELFAEYERLSTAWETKKQELEQATIDRSNACAAIAKFTAPNKRIRFQGKEYLIVQRGDTTFFRSPKNVIEVG